mgnify:CR=1 FL=1
MGLIEKYLNQSKNLISEFLEVREDNLFLFSQSGTNLSSVYWTKKVKNFPFTPGDPIYPHKFVNGVKIDEPVYPKAIIRIRMNSPAMGFIANSGDEIDWNQFKEMEGWYYG